MKEKIVNALKTKFVGVSENILNRVADKLSKNVTTEEQVTTAVEGVTFQSILESYGDSRANEAQATAVKNYETKHHLKDGKPYEQDERSTPTTGDEIPEWAKAIVESNKALTAKVEEMEAEKVGEYRRKRFEKVIGKLPESQRKGYSRTNLNGSDEEFEKMLTEVEAEVEEAIKDNNQKRTIFGKPLTGGDTEGEGEATDKEADEVLAKMFNN